MTKSYVKDPNGKYKLVDRDQKVEKPLSLEELDLYLDLETSSRARSSCCKSCGGNETPTIFCLIDIISNGDILVNYVVYLSGVPGHRKLLPRPCPQCGAETGGVQFVFFNHRFYKERTGYNRTKPYHLLRISHYSKEEYHSKRNKNKKYKPTKIWHTFQFSGDFKINYGSEVMSIDELFDQPYYIDKQSVWFTMGDSWYDSVKKNGWPTLVNEGAHWFNKDGPKKCQECSKIVERLRKCLIWFEEKEKYKPWVYSDYIWLCQPCHLNKEAKRLQQIQVHNEPLSI